MLSLGGNRMGQWESVGTDHDVRALRARSGNLDTHSLLTASQFQGDGFSLLSPPSDSSFSGTTPSVTLQSSRNNGTIYFGADSTYNTGIVSGGCGITLESSLGASQSQFVSFPYPMLEVPGSVELQQDEISNCSVSVANVTQYGFELILTPSSDGLISFRGSYITSPNDGGGGGGGGGGGCGNVGQAAYDYAFAQVGCPYVFGGSACSPGFDCSGLTKEAWFNATNGDVDLAHHAYTQFHSVPRVCTGNCFDQAIAGDLVFFNFGNDCPPSCPGHVAIAQGDGVHIVSATNPGTGVEYKTIGSWAGNVMGVGRPQGGGCLVSGIDLPWGVVATPGLLSGLDFVIDKASQGTSGTWSGLQHNVDVFESVGIEYGFFHFGSSQGTGSAQWTHFINTVSGVVSDPHAHNLSLDWEVTGGMSEANGREFVTTAQNAGYKIGVYASEGRPYPNWGQDWRWVAHWGVPKPGIPYDVHQYTNSKNINGHLYDGDRSPHSLDDLNAIWHD